MHRTLLAAALAVALTSSRPALAHEGTASGIVMTSVGGGLLLTGVILTFSTIPFWIDGLDLDKPTMQSVSADDVVDIGIATTLTLIGAGCIVVGAILLPKGINRLRGVQPSAFITPHGAVFGLAGAF